MRFLFPSGLFWLALAAFAVALYLFRRKPRRVPVTSLLFFKTLAKEHQESAWLRKLKKLISLLLTLLVVLGAIFALSGMVISPSSGAVNTVVIAVDRSASMAAAGSDKESRLEQALKMVRGRLAGLPSGVDVIVMAFDQRPEILLPRSLDHREILRALDRIRTKPAQGNPDAALKLARQLAGLNPPAEIWMATDETVRESKEDKLSIIGIQAAAKEAQNVGITAFEVRPLPLEQNRFEAFTEATATSDTSAQIEIRLDGTLTAVREIDLKAGKPEALSLPIEAAPGKLLTVTVKSKVPDQLEADNTVVWRTPEHKSIKVLWLCDPPDPFVRLALQTIASEGGVEIYQGTMKEWPPKEAVDVVIFERELPEKWPENVAVFAIDPQKSLGPFQLSKIGGEGLPLDRVRAVQERHPVLYGVASGRALPLQTSVLQSDVLDSLWTGSAGSLLLAGEYRGQRVVVMGFAPDRSPRLPLLASFPLLVGNAIYWLQANESHNNSARTLQTGVVTKADGKTLRWTVPTADGKVEQKTESKTNEWVELDRIGTWETDAGQFGNAALLSRSETLLPTSAVEIVSGSGPVLGLSGDLTSLLIGLALAALLLEAWLFHRHAVY